jgi:hypothetical protein
MIEEILGLSGMQDQGVHCRPQPSREDFSID